MNLKVLILITAFLFGMAGISETKAQQTDTLHLDLNTALQIALSESPVVRIAEREVKRVDYSQRSAWNNLLPNLSASAQHAHFLAPGRMTMFGQVMDSPARYNTTMGLNMSLPLFAPGLWHAIRMTELDMQLAVERALASRITLRSDVSRAFYGVLLAQDSHASLLQTFELAQESYQQARTRYELGLGSEFDMISAQVQMRNLEPTILEVEMGIDQTITLLKILIGLDINQPVKIIGSLADYENRMISSTEFINLTMDFNSDLRQLDLQQQQLQRALQMQRTQRLPTLAGFATYGISGTGTRAMNIDFGGMPIPIERRDDWFPQGLIAGVQLNIPITGIFTNRANERQTAVQIQMLDIQRQSLEHSLNLQVRTALNNMDRAMQQAETARANQYMAQRGYDIALRRYEVGAGAFIETQSALQALTQARIAHHQAIANYLNSKIELERTLGYSIR